MNEIVLREFDMRDMSNYYELYHAIVNEKVWFSNDEPYSYEASATFRKQVYDGGYPMTVAYDGDKLVGWCDIFPCDGVNKLGIGIAQGYRDKGLGRRLMSEMLDRCRVKEYSTIYLDVFAANVRAISLYTKCGFTVVEASSKSAMHNGSMKESIMMKYTI